MRQKKIKPIFRKYAVLMLARVVFQKKVICQGKYFEYKLVIYQVKIIPRQSYTKVPVYLFLRGIFLSFDNNENQVLYRFRMHVEDDLRVCLSSIPPRMEKLCTALIQNKRHLILMRRGRGNVWIFMPFSK